MDPIKGLLYVEGREPELLSSLLRLLHHHCQYVQGIRTPTAFPEAELLIGQLRVDNFADFAVQDCAEDFCQYGDD